MAQQTNNTPARKSPGRTIQLRTIISAVVYLFLPPTLLFGGAGTLRWGMAWVYLAITFGAVILSRVLVARVHPDLLRERASSMDAKDVPSWDRKLVPFITTIIPMLIMLTAGLDKRFALTSPLGSVLLIMGVILVLGAVSLATWAMVVNKFFSAYVRIQEDRGQRVVSGGPYGIIRHPGYAAGILTNLGAPLMLGSGWALAPSILGIAIILTRTALEDKWLQERLPGYKEYAQRIRWRILPSIW